ncbi:MAG: ribonuclease [Methylobacteriaceae bacterium]|jgi:ribonuclease T2|nr:ribonuclease [Methylobacteriaceae bacterium]
MRRRGFLLVAASLAFASGAFAQGPKAGDSGCILDNCADKKPLPAQSAEAPAAAPSADRARPRGASAPGDFDFYVLSLSWSPGFCQTGGTEKHRSQCNGGSGLGFVVHGLWPQYETGFPSDCGPAGRSPSRIALEGTKGVYPDINLARYEWRKHGTCSGKSPTDYFADVRRARDTIEIPPPFRAASDKQTWTPIDIERAFIAANPKLRPDMMAIACRSGVLEEVRICFSKDLREFRTCPEVSRGSCRTRELRVPAPL